jgi:hypothetical protein
MVEEYAKQLGYTWQYFTPRYKQLGYAWQLSPQAQTAIFQFLLTAFQNSLADQNLLHTIPVTFLVSHWLNVFLFSVSKGGGRGSRNKKKTASVALSAFQREQGKSASVGMMI